MGLNKQYIRVGQSAKNSLFGVGPDGRTNTGKSPRGSPTLQMLISNQGKINHGRVAVIMFGVFTLAVGIILSSIPWLDYLVLRNLRLWNGSLSFHYWQKPGVIRLTKMYIFNISNPDGFLNLGEKPKLQEIGPFVYRENMEKVNIKFHDNGTVTYQHKKILKFVPELSVDGNAKLTVPNIPLLALSTMSNNLGYVIQKTISFVLTVGKFHPFISVTADELVFGYDDRLVALAHRFYPKGRRPMSKMGLLISRNGTLNEVSTIQTGLGSGGMNEFGLLTRLNGKPELPWWKDAPCTQLSASEGSFFPPRKYNPKNDTIYVYDKDLCRVLPLEYQGSTTKQGINVDLWLQPESAYDSSREENKCFYRGMDSPAKGLQYIGPCQSDAPLYISNPHFYQCDPALLEGVEGLKPEKEKHQTYFKIQPKIGVPLEGHVRIQINLKVERAYHVAAVSNFPSIVYPIMWLQEGVEEVTPEIRTWIYLATTFADIAEPFVNYLTLTSGAVVLVTVFIRAYKNLVFTRQTIEIGMRTLRRGSTFIVNGQHRLMMVRDSYTLLDNATIDTDPDPGPVVDV